MAETSPNATPPNPPQPALIPGHIVSALGQERAFREDVAEKFLRDAHPDRSMAVFAGAIAGALEVGTIAVGVPWAGAVLAVAGYATFDGVTSVQAIKAAKLHAAAQTEIGERYEVYDVGFDGERHIKVPRVIKFVGRTVVVGERKVRTPDAKVLRWDADGEDLKERLTLMATRADAVGIHRVAVNKAAAEKILPEQAKNLPTSSWSAWLSRATGYALRPTAATGAEQADEVVISPPTKWLSALAESDNVPTQRRKVDVWIERLGGLYPDHPLVTTYRAFATSRQDQIKEASRVSSELLQFSFNDTELVLDHGGVRLSGVPQGAPKKPQHSQAGQPPVEQSVPAASGGAKPRQPGGLARRYRRQAVTGTLTNGGQSVRWQGPDRSWTQAAAESLELREEDVELLTKFPGLNPKVAERVLTLRIHQQLQTDPEAKEEKAKSTESVAADSVKLSWPTQGETWPRAQTLPAHFERNISLRNQRRRQLVAAGLAGMVLFAGGGMVVNVVDSWSVHLPHGRSANGVSSDGSGVGDIDPSNPNVRDWQLHPHNMNAEGYWSLETYNRLEGDTWLADDQPDILIKKELPTAVPASISEYIEVDLSGATLTGSDEAIFQVPVLLGTAPVAATVNGEPVTRVELTNGTYGLKLTATQLENTGNLRYWVAAGDDWATPHLSRPVTASGKPAWDKTELARVWEQAVPQLSGQTEAGSVSRAAQETDYVQKNFDYSLRPLDGHVAGDFKTWSALANYMATHQKDICNEVSTLIALDNPNAVNVASGYRINSDDVLASHESHQWVVTARGGLLDGSSSRVSAEDAAYFKSPLGTPQDTPPLEKPPVPLKDIGIVLGLEALGAAAFGSWVGRRSIRHFYGDAKAAAAVADGYRRRARLEEIPQHELAITDAVVGQVVYADPNERLNGVRLTNRAQKDKTPAADLVQKFVDRQDLRDPAVIARLRQLKRAGGLTPPAKAAAKTAIRVLRRAHRARGSQSFRTGDIAEATV